MLSKLIREHRGAASIFLLIILLPSLTMAGVFIDVARVKLAEEVVSSSADLALNTTLTAYDKDLKDFYGLIASCQDTSDVIEVSKKYFAESMVSAGVDTSDAEYHANNVIGAILGEKQVTDMLQISVDSCEITRTANGAMNNPALIKEGISEFMKYRSPINNVAELFSKITESGVSDKLQSTSAEATMIDAREAFYKAEKALIKQAEAAYKAIKKYEEHKAHTGDLVASEAFVEKFSAFLIEPLKNCSKKDGINELEITTAADWETIYRDAHMKMVKNLFNTHSTARGLPITLLYNTSSIATQDEKTTYSDDNKASSARIETFLKNFNTTIVAYYNARSDLQSAWESIGSKGNSDYDIQYWVKLTDKCSSKYSTYKSAAEAVWNAANELDNAVTFAKEKAMNATMSRPVNNYVTIPAGDEDGNVTLSEVYNALWQNYVSSIQSEATGGGSTAYRHINSQIGRLKTGTNEKLLKVSSVNHIYNIRNDLNAFVNDAKKAAELAKTAQTAVSLLKDKIKTYKEKFDEWKTAANDPSLANNDLAAQDIKLITDLENGGMINMSESSVTELAAKLGRICTLYSTLEKDMKAIKYNGKSVLDIYDYATFRSASKASNSAVPMNKNSLEEYATGLFSFSIGTEIQAIAIRDGTTSTELDAGDYYMITDSFHPIINKEKSFELYTWLYNKFSKGTSSNQTLNPSTHGVTVDDEESAEEADEKFDKKTDDTSAVDTTAGTKAKDFKSWSGATLPSKDKNAPEAKSVTTQLKDAATYASSLFSNFGETFMGTLENVRDDLFAEDYIFSMFTHDTFDNEGYYSLLSEEDQGKVKPSNVTTYYTDKVKKDWAASDEVKTLTLQTRSKTNNWAYGGEIEYIMYGNNTDASNKTTAYANIFLIRYALDLAPIFDIYWEDPVVRVIADVLQAFAYIPASLTKTLICLAITAAEAAQDIKYLKYGIPVLIYKSKEEDVFCNYQTVFLGEGTASGSKDGFTLQYSDYIKMFLFIKLTSDENQIYLRTGDIIQANMSLAAKNTSYSLSKAQVFYTLKTTAKIKPMWSSLLAIDDLGDLTTSDGWRTVTTTVTRGY